MDKFERRDNDILKKHCSESKIMIVPQNMTYRFQSLNLTVSKVAKAFIQSQYNDWFSNQAANQLKSGKDPANIKISSKLLELKSLHAGWIVKLHNHQQGECETIVKGFKKAGVVEAIKDPEPTKESETRLGRKTFFRRLYKYYFLSLKKKKMDNKVDVLVQLISC